VPLAKISDNIGAFEKSEKDVTIQKRAGEQYQQKSRALGYYKEDLIDALQQVLAEIEKPGEYKQ
jgi:hypothetical protein